ncbi:MAG TPA: Ni-sirohydrochlorin a,c-diamide reductive cyclase catalytic subunit, partial [Methanobacteriales archaeon]|nr:Ni-sirohydrochlorin a,c-diamide reductive cyclase catalytic subunit [Methanobacteriales archaeon]
NIKSELEINGIKIDYLTGGLDEYPITGERVGEILKEENVEFAVISGVPHAVPIEELDVKSVAVTDGPRLVKPLKELGYDYVVAELDAHAKTLGVDKIVQSDFGKSIRENIKVI